MNEPNQNQPDDRDLQLIDALLERAVGSDAADDEAKIVRLMSSLRSESQTVVSPQPLVRNRKSIWRWLSVPLVASLAAAILLFTLPNNSTQAAIAAIDRSIAVASEQLDVREYSVAITTRRLNGGTRVREHQLFVRQNDFVIRSDAWIGKGEIWAGGRGEERWVVPRFGAVVIGKAGVLPRKADGKVLETPFLSVERILERAKRFYDLDIEESVEIEIGEETFVCDRIVGNRTRSPRIVIPRDVEIFIDPKTGFARRVQLRWDPGENPRWLEASADLIGTREVADDFFQHTGHHDGTRRVISE